MYNMLNSLIINKNDLVVFDYYLIIDMWLSNLQEYLIILFVCVCIWLIIYLVLKYSYNVRYASWILILIN